MAVLESRTHCSRPRPKTKTCQKRQETNVYCNYGSQEAGLIKHRVNKMNSIGIWCNKNTRYKIHIIQCTVHNIKRKTKHIHLLFWKWPGRIVEEGHVILSSRPLEIKNMASRTPTLSHAHIHTDSETLALV